MRILVSSALRLLFRNWKSGELKLIFLAVSLSAVCMTSMLFLTQNLAAGLTRSTSALLGSDLTFKTNNPIDPMIIVKAHEVGLETTTTVSIFNMVVHHDEIVLGELKGIAKNYPLRGVIKTRDQFGAEAEVTNTLPKIGTAWVEPQLLARLGIEVGDSVDIGESTFIITHVLLEDPDRTLNVFGMSPLLVLNYQDLQKVISGEFGVPQVNYTLFLAGTIEAQGAFRQWLTPRLQPTDTFRISSEASPRIERTLNQMHYYLSLAFILVVSLSGIAIALVSRRFSRRQFSTVALLRCFGASRWWVLLCYILLLFMIVLGAGCLGVAVGCLAGYAFALHFFQDVLVQPVNFLVAQPLLFGLSSAGVLVLGFAVPPLLSLHQISAIRVLRKNLPEPTLNRLWVFIIPTGLIFLLIYPQVQSAYLAGRLLVLSLVLGLSVFGVMTLLLWLLSKLNTAGKSVMLRNIRNRLSENGLQLVAFNLVFTCVGVVFLVQSDLLSFWQKNIEPTIPNYFAVNISPQQKPEFSKFLQENRAEANHIYPMVSARLAKVNDEPVGLDGKLDGSSRSLHRLIKVGATNVLDESNRIVAGRWFNTEDERKLQISVEKKFAERLDIQLGAEVEFFLGGKAIKAKVTSLREVNWDSFRPNFFVLFPPGVLDAFSPTYMTSFYLPNNNIHFAGAVVRQFPNVNLFDINMILTKMRKFLQMGSTLIEYLWLMIVAMSSVLLFATILASLDERKREARLFRILGVSHLKLKWILLSEFMLLGFISGSVAVVCANAIVYWLADRVFHFPFVINGWFGCLLPLISMLVLSLGGYLGTRSVFSEPPLRQIES